MVVKTQSGELLIITMVFVPRNVEQASAMLVVFGHDLPSRDLIIAWTKTKKSSKDHHANTAEDLLQQSASHNFQDVYVGA